MKVLFCGDVVGSPGRRVIKELIPPLKEELALDFVVVNAENAAGGSGLTPQVVREIFSSGVDIITTGDHIWKKKDVFDIIDTDCLLRPANYKDFLPGKGFCVKQKGNIKLAVINLAGRVFMDNKGACPFLKARAILEELENLTPNIIVDFHAEATSEKVAMGYFLAGRVSAVMGTHTHIPTADERIIEGTGFITDVGMTGGFDSVLGRKKEKVIEHFLTDLPQRFEVSCEDPRLQAALLDVDENTGRCKDIKRVERKI